MPEGLPIVDAFMGIPFPDSQAVKKYEFLKRQLRDEGSKTMAMPAEYMFKGVPKYDEIDDPVELLVVGARPLRDLDVVAQREHVTPKPAAR